MSKQHPLSIRLREACRAESFVGLDALINEVIAFLNKHHQKMTKMRQAALKSPNIGRKRIEFDLAVAQSLRAKGLSYRAIADEMGMRPNTVRNRLAESIK